MVYLMRKVLHVDCDCFFAAVEMRERPELASVPLAIGGSSERRGVIATCNYPAREYGVRSAMSTAKALMLCPNLVLLPGNMALYSEVSAQVMAILKSYAVSFQQVSVDEAYLEIHPDQLASEVATQIRARVREEVGISVSVGGAPNKFLAKVASDWNKPDGQKLIAPHQVDEFVADLAVRKIPGVGPSFEKRLAALSIETCRDVHSWSLKDLVRRFGRSGLMLYQRSRGIDERPLSEPRERKSISVEHTYSQDLTTPDQCLSFLPDLYEKWQGRLERKSLTPEALSPFVKVKFADFTQTTLSDIQEVASLKGFQCLLEQALRRQDKPVRLLGIGGKLPERCEQQLSLF